MLFLYKNYSSKFYVIWIFYVKLIKMENHTQAAGRKSERENDSLILFFIEIDGILLDRRKDLPKGT